MYIFFSILIFIIGIIFFIIGIKKQNQDLIKLEKTKSEYLENRIKDTIKRCNDLEQLRKQLELQRDAAIREQSIEKKHLEELRTYSREFLLTERKRTDSEIEAIRQLKMKQLQQEFEDKYAKLEHDFTERRNEIDAQLAVCQDELKSFQDIQASINEAARRKREIEEQESFYSIDVSENDREDISILQSMDTRLHNRDVIPKLIWELFIRRPTQEMIKRVVGNEKASGIYKITYKNTGEAYIGKTTDFAVRWANHIKTAIGLEGAARATLHNRMAKDGIWNYTFEILERVDKESLASRESYYINLYGTKSQLNMKEGNKNGTQ